MCFAYQNSRGMVFINKRKNNIILFVLLFFSSIVIYLIQYFMFHRTNEMLFLTLQDLAFLPVEVAIVTFVIDRILSSIEKQKKTKKINVIISTFFTEAGVTILAALAEFNRSDTQIVEIIKENENGKMHQTRAKILIKSLEYDMYAEPEKLDALKSIMADKKAFLLNLLENSSLLEHDTFTDMLWAVFHVADELQNRGDLKDLSKPVIDHLSNDFLRAYSAMVQEWLGYIFYLHDEYPFLYQTAKNKAAAVNTN